MRSLITFSSGILLGFAAGVLIDKENRKKIQNLAKNQTERIKSYEQTLRNSIDKIKNVIEEKKAKVEKK